MRWRVKAFRFEMERVYKSLQQTAKSSCMRSNYDDCSSAFPKPKCTFIKPQCGDSPTRCVAMEEAVAIVTLSNWWCRIRYPRSSLQIATSLWISPSQIRDLAQKNELDIVVSKSATSASYGHGSLVCGWGQLYVTFWNHILAKKGRFIHVCALQSCGMSVVCTWELRGIFSDLRFFVIPSHTLSVSFTTM